MSVTELSVTPGVGRESTVAPYAEVLVRRKTTNGLALASLTLGVLWLAGLGSLLAVIFASIAKCQVRESDGWQSGDGMATAGLALGIVGLAPVLLVTVVAGAVALA